MALSEEQILAEQQAQRAFQVEQQEKQAVIDRTRELENLNMSLVQQAVALIMEERRVADPSTLGEIADSDITSKVNALKALVITE